MLPNNTLVKPQSRSSTTLPIQHFERQKDWARWLEENHSSSKGVWLQLAKKGSDIPSVSYDEAIEVALCFGWIDGQKKTHSEQFWLQKFTRRSDKSVWSKLNKDKVFALIETGKMKPAGLQEVERAKSDGRWDAAYDSASKATVPSDFQTALDSNTRAKDFFGTLDSRNRYAILFRIQTAKKAETRAKKIAQFVQMLDRHEKVHA
ncbi:YdeI family protein [Thiobacillus sp.]|uniref:YdeI/OmpD-associated family protein n=1 Tax=Thiobacillus sp. TaxID=924 RepID=UPI0025F2EAFD|nr:YdeI/OmpD-associated family protein [Thiobacillus sp.]MBT9541306.1 YdeI/OmpD-associated family protein [Thiobacillus sp.]